MKPSRRRSSIAVRELVDSVVALSEDPGPATVARYLAASRALENSGRADVTPIERAPSLARRRAAAQHSATPTRDADRRSA
jgi:hypothetical protein